jgi:hypothetical protein
MFKDLDELERLSKAARGAIILQQTEEMWKKWERQVSHLVPSGPMCFCSHHEGEHMEVERIDGEDGPYRDEFSWFAVECQIPGCGCKSFRQRTT